MIKERIFKIKSDIVDVCRKVNRDPKTVNILAATKYQPIPRILETVHSGINIIGENKVQELNEKIPFLPKDLRIDFIGHLQTNKVMDVVSSCKLIHSIDSLKLAERINFEAKKINKKQAVLLEINISGEKTKSGFDKETIYKSFAKINNMPNILIKGLMTIAPNFNNPELAKSIFKELRQISRDLENNYKISLPELSMGMSNDYKIAIEEGATIIRLGRIIFE